MEENEDSGDKDICNTVISNKLISSNETSSPKQMENNLPMQKKLNSPKSSIEKESNGVKKSYINDNGLHDGDSKSFVNGLAKTLLDNGDERFVVGHEADKKSFINGNCKKISEEKSNNGNFRQDSDMIGDTVDTLEQYTSRIDATLENLEQCKTELSNKLSNHTKTRTNETMAKNENAIKNENGLKNENGIRNENGSINNGSINNGSINNGSINNGKINNGKINNGKINNGSVNNGSINNGSINNGSINNGNINNGFVNGSNEEFFPLVSMEDDEIFSTIPDAMEDEDMLIQEKIMQSKSELVSKLNSQNVRNLMINNEDEIKNGHDSVISDINSEIATSSSSLREAINGESKELTLFEACRQGHYGKVKDLLTSNSNVDVNMTDGDCWSCLHETSIRNCQFTPITELLLQNGANANLKDKKGETPLHGAVLFHLVDTIKLLLEYKADFNICNNQNVSPLKLATYLKDNEILLLFGEPISEDKIVKKKKKKRKRNSHKDFTLPVSTSPSILKKRRTSDEPSSSTKPHSKKRINFSL